MPDFRSGRSGKLKPFLDRLYDRYHRPEYLSSDPLEFAHRFADPHDREAVALVSALLAYGNVRQIRKSVEDFLFRVRAAGLTPSGWVRSLGSAQGLARAEPAFEGFVHRFQNGGDLIALFRLLERSWREYGAMGAHFLSHHRAGVEGGITAGLDGLIADWKGWIAEMPATRLSPGFGHFLTAPVDGSCCKRWCMLIRWMGRERGAEGDLDLGLWREGSPLAATFPPGKALRASELVIPLDTHTGRISQYLGLTRRKSLNWKAALEVTRALKSCDPEDPVRYDFALARLGILDRCQRKYRKEICSECELVKVCKWGSRSLRKEKRS